MKRALLIIPVATAAIGVLLLVWHRTVESRVGAGRGGAPSRGPEAPPSRPPPAHFDARPSDSPKAAEARAGSLRLHVHARGQAVAGAKVDLGPASGPRTTSFETAGDGTGIVGGVAAGEYRVVVRHPLYLTAQARVRVEPAQAADLAVELKEGGRLFGAVTNAQGAPLPGTSIQLLDAVSRGSISPDLEARSDAEGRYVLNAVPPGEFGVRFRHERYRPLDRAGLSFRGSGDAHEVNAVLEPGTVVSGRVTDEAGAPLAGATVTAANESGGVVRTDAEGRFTMYGLGDSPVHCSVGARGYGTVYLRGVKPDTTGLDIRLPKAGAVSGRVEAESLPGWFAICLSRYDEDFGREMRVQTKTFASPAGGAFLMPDVAPGSYAVEIEAEGYEALDRPQVVVDRGQTSAEVRIRLRKKAR